MTQSQAVAFASTYTSLVLGKPIKNDKDFENALISEVVLKKISENNYQVLVVAWLPKKGLTKVNRNLIVYLDENNIPIERKRFGLPERPAK